MELEDVEYLIENEKVIDSNWCRNKYGKNENEI